MTEAFRIHVSYSSAGLCQGCVRRRKRTNQPITKNQPKTTVDVIATHRSLTAYLEWRRPFREKAGIRNGN